MSRSDGLTGGDEGGAGGRAELFESAPSGFVLLVGVLRLSGRRRLPCAVAQCLPTLPSVELLGRPVWVAWRIEFFFRPLSLGLCQGRGSRGPHRLRW